MAELGAIVGGSYGLTLQSSDATRAVWVIPNYWSGTPTTKGATPIVTNINLARVIPFWEADGTTGLQIDSTGSFSGVTYTGTPSARVIKGGVSIFILWKPTGTLVARITSHATTGAWRFDGLRKGNNQDYIVVFASPAGSPVYSSLIYDYIAPV